MAIRRLRVIGLWTFAGLLVCLASVGCSESPTAPPVARAEQTAPPAQAAPAPERETWDVTYIQGSRVGYGRTTISRINQSGREAVKLEGLDRLTIKRFGQETILEIRVSSVETPEGKLLSFESEIAQAETSLRTTGRVVGDRLQLETTTRGKKTSTSIPWSAEYRGPFADTQTLLDKPMQPGQRRTIRALDPSLNQVVTYEMTGKGREPVRLPTGTYDLLRIDTTIRLPNGQTIRGSVWTDRTGETLKARTDMMGLAMEKIRATKAMALEKTEAGELDLGTHTAVKVNRPLPRPHQTKRVRYRVQLKEGDPAAVFVSGDSQAVKSIDAHTAEVTVYALRPGQPGGNPKAAADPPTDDERRANNMIQSDNPKIAAMARQAAGNAQDPWQVALALERYVNGYITEVAFSQALATAADVAENRVGDCTEHAVLLAALARARGIPARVAMGLVYVARQQAFGYHMWTEVYVGKRWIPLDATLGLGGIGAAHLKLAHSSLKGASAFSSFLPVIQVIGGLKVEILEVE